MIGPQKRGKKMGITQKDIVQSFVNGATEGRCGGAGNLVILGDKLIHYQTIISERVDDKYIINMTRYSIVTGRVQKEIENAVPQNNRLVVNRVPEGYRGSLKEFLN